MCAARRSDDSRRAAPRRGWTRPTARRAWHRLGDDEFDVVVIGGGVTGAGAALDAATRGLSVALVEARDFASGTSSRSSKLFHGGLRYLEQLEFGLVREALRERELMTTRLAPHLVKPVPFLYPLTHRAWERPYVAAGLALYDTIGGHSSLPGQKHLSRRAALRMFPGLRADALVGAVRYFDAQADDARHTLTVARTAARYGAVVRSSTQAVGFVRESDRVVGVVVRDAEDGRETTVARRRRAQLHRRVDRRDAGAVRRPRAVPGARVEGRAHRRAAREDHRRRRADPAHATSVLFVIPWKNHWLIGTTDTDWNLDLAHPAATKSDIDYLLDCVNSVLVAPLTHDDIEGVYAGLRPLLAGESEETSALSREHAVARVVPGLISIAGGKYTTYRVMAADAVDAGGEDLPQPRRAVVHRPGAAARRGRLLRDAQPGRGAGRRVRPAPVPGAARARPVRLDDPRRARARAWPTRRCSQTVPGAPDYLMAEIRYAVTHEGALHLEDVLTRRTRISIEYPHRGVESAPRGRRADRRRPRLGRRAARRARSSNYIARVEAERESQSRFDDEAADAVRTAAPEVRTHLRRRERA